MPETSFKELLDAGVHFGHLKRKWNPAMAPYIFMEKNGIHIIDLNKTEIKLKEAASAMKQIAKSGRKILFVATKKQAKEIVSERVKEINMPYVTERWPGGMLTNFPTIRKAVKKMATIDKMSTDGTFDTLSKRERLQITRQRAKLEKNLGSISDLTRLPAAMFIVDVTKEYIAVREAKRLNIPVFAMVDTNSDPRDIDFPIPANDDASKSIDLIVNYVTEAVAEGLNERKMEKEKEAADSKAKSKEADKQKAAVVEESKGEERKRPRTGDRKERKRVEGARPEPAKPAPPAAGAAAQVAPPEAGAAAKVAPPEAGAAAKVAPPASESPAARQAEKSEAEEIAAGAAKSKMGPPRTEEAVKEEMEKAAVEETGPAKVIAGEKEKIEEPEKPKSETGEAKADAGEAKAEAEEVKAEADAGAEKAEAGEAKAEAEEVKAEADAGAEKAEAGEAKTGDKGGEDKA